MTKVARSFWGCEVFCLKFQKLSKECRACIPNYFCETINGSEDHSKDCVKKSIVFSEDSKVCGECYSSH